MEICYAFIQISIVRFFYMEKFVIEHPQIVTVLIGVIFSVVAFLIKNKMKAIDNKATKTCREVEKIKTNYLDKFDEVDDKFLELHLKIDKHHLANQTTLAKLVTMQQEQTRFCKFIQDGKRR